MPFQKFFRGKTLNEIGSSIYKSLDEAALFLGPGGRSGLHYAGVGAAAGIVLGDKEQAWYTRAARGAAAGYLFGGPLHRQFGKDAGQYATAKKFLLGTGAYLAGFEDDLGEGAIVGGVGLGLAGSFALGAVGGARGVFARSMAGVGATATAAVAPIAWSMNQSYQDSYSDEALLKQHRIKRFQQSAYDLTNSLHYGRHG